MNLVEQYDKGDWLGISEIVARGVLTDKKGKPYSYQWVKRLVSRQVKGGATYFSRPDGGQAIILVPYMNTRFQYRVHKDAIANYKPYATYVTYSELEYDDATRNALIERLREGESPNQLADEYGLAPVVVYALKARLEEL